MKYWAIILIAAIVGSIAATIPADSYIPPTRAFMRIFGNNENITASSYNANLTFSTGGALNIDLYPNNNTVRFTGGTPNMAFENLSNVTHTGCSSGQTRVVNASGWYVCYTIGTGNITGAANVGGGTGTIFRDVTGNTINLKTLAAGSGISITNNANDISISTTGSGGYTKINNLDGGTAKILATNSSGQATVKTLTAGTGITITNGSKTITIDATGTGGITKANSLDGGNAGIVGTNSSTQVTFKTLTAGSGIGFTNGSKSVTISCTGCGTSESTTGSNLGTSGQGVFSALVGFDLQFKRLISSTLSLTSNSTNVIIEATGGFFNKINSLNGGDASLVATNQSGQATIKTLTAGSGISLTNGTKTITITATGSGGFTKVNNVGTGTIKLVQTNSSNTANIKSITTVRGITLTNGTTTAQIDTNFKVNSITAQNKVWLTGFNNATTSGDFSTRTFALNNQTYIKGDIQIIGINNVTGVVTTNTFSVNNSTCTGNQFLKQINNSTGFTVCATPASTGGSGFTQVSTLTGGDASTLYSNSSNKAIFKKLAQTANNVTISGNSTGILTWNLGSNVVTTGGSDQNFTKNIGFNTDTLYIRWGADPADAGQLRLPASSGGATNGIYWESVPTGSDLSIVTNLSNNLIFSTTFGSIDLNSNPLLNAILGGTLNANSQDITNVNTLTTPTDPADVGRIRLNNADLIASEASPAGTDGTIGFNANEEWEIIPNTNEIYSFNSTHLDVGTNKLGGTMGCSDGQSLQLGGGDWDCVTASGSTAWAKDATRKTADFTATTSSGTIIVDSYGGNRTITLPLASGSSGQAINIYRNDTGPSRNWVMVKTTSPDSLDNSNNFNLTLNGGRLVVQSNGTKWFNINKNENNRGDFPIIPTKGTGANRWWQPQHASNTALTTLLAQTAAIQAYPFVLPTTTTFDRGEIDVSALLAGSTCRIGIYTSDFNGYPAKLISGTDTGTISTAATGRQGATFTAPITLPPGLYYTAVQCSSAATLTLRANPVAAQADILGFGSGTAPATTAGFSCTRAYAAFPTNYCTASQATYLGAVSQHAVFLRATG